MKDYVYTGVRNTNGNKYEKTITKDELKKHIDLSLIEENDYREMVEWILSDIDSDDSKFEHVDTYLKEDGNWRFQIWVNIHYMDIPKYWRDIQNMKNLSIYPYSQWFRVDESIEEWGIKMVATFVVPGK